MARLDSGFMFNASRVAHAPAHCARLSPPFAPSNPPTPLPPLPTLSFLLPSPSFSYPQSLSVALLHLDPSATMDVSPLDDDAYELDQVLVFGRVLRGFGPVTADTDVRRIVAVCTAMADRREH